MRQLLVAVSVSALLVGLTGCAGDGGTAEDPAGRDSHGPMPTAPVAANGAVVTRGAATVMDVGGPELCLGPVAESYPPQCSGPALTGWDWAEQEGSYDQQGDVRWGVFSVTGTWDGATYAATSAEPADGADGGGRAGPGLEPPPVPADRLPAQDLERIADEVRRLGGATGAYAGDTQVLVDVPYDDGSLQDWVDAEYGAGVVAVTPALVDA
jgi:hypothetical protein